MSSLPEVVFQSNLLQMQIDELLKEIKLKDKHVNAMELWLNQLTRKLYNIPEGETIKLEDYSGQQENQIQVPLISPPNKVKGIFRFLPPTEARIVGSFPLRLAANPPVTVDVAVSIPRECTQQRDYLNYSYHVKRALYLTHIANHLQMHTELIEDLSFTYQHDNHTKPILLIKPKGRLGKYFTVCILPVLQPDFFKIVRFYPTKNNVRMSWFFGTSMDTEDLAATPHYNSSFLMDMLVGEYAQFLQSIFEDCRELRNAVILLKVWLRQRSLDQGKGAFTGFIMSMFVAYLLKKHRVSPLMSSYQVMRNTLLALSQSELCDVGITLQQGNAGTNKPSLSEFHQAYDVVFVDHLGENNITSFVSREMFQRVKHEAGLCVKFIDTLQSNCFDGLFIKPVPFLHTFDHVMHITQIDSLIEAVLGTGMEAELVDHSGDAVTIVMSRVTELLRAALGKRIHLLDVKPWALGTWSITSSPPDPNNIDKITIGFIVNAEFANNAVGRGPSADSTEAVEFRKFWAPLSELRRFQDGSICEAVVWKANSLAEKRIILQQITAHVLNSRFGISSETLEFISNQLEQVLMLPGVQVQVETSYGTGEEANILVMQSFGELSKQLRKIDLPLPITSIQGISPTFRFTEIFPPLPVNPPSVPFPVKNQCVVLKEASNPAPPWVEPLTMIVHLEGSGKWPDEIQALRHTKAAFHVKIAKLLKSNFSLPCVAHPEHVDIYRDGFVFRLQVACHKEITLLKQVTTPEGMIKVVESDDAKELEYRTEVLPKLTGIIHGLQQQHHTFSSACRIAKRWISAHLLSLHLSEVVIEILMAHIYLTAAPFMVPGSPQVAFLRFLNLLATFDWKTVPLFVSLNSDVKPEELAEIQSTFTRQRPVLPPMFISTPLDTQISMWTRTSPTAPILHRIITLAKATLETLCRQFYSPQSEDFKLIFRPPLDMYDVIIHLKDKQLPKRGMAIDVADNYVPAGFMKSSTTNVPTVLPVVGHDPVAFYLNELVEAYSEFALFFYDTYGGDKIGVLWKPQAFSRQPFKVSHINGRMMAEVMTTGSIIPNIEAIVEDFQIIGMNLVSFVEMKTDKWTIN